MRTPEEEAEKIEEFCYIMKWTFIDCAALALVIVLLDAFSII